MSQLANAPRRGREAEDKEIKVRIPIPHHIKLHTIKVLHGQSISFTVRQALDAYFRDFEARDGLQVEGSVQVRLVDDSLSTPP